MFESYFIIQLLSFLSYYSFSYIISQWYFKNDKLQRFYWDIITRLASTYNAINCIVMTYYVLKNLSGIGNFYDFQDEYVLKTLTTMTSYLFIDGLFLLPDLYHNFNLNNLTTVIHHFVGAYGIYKIVSTRLALGMGIYFAMTEISTPFLNLTWLTKKLKLFLYYSCFIIFYILFLFCRILTMPYLLYYESYNIEIIQELPLDYKLIFYFGIWSLMLLNVIWFIGLTFKITNIENLNDIKKNKKEK